VSDQVFAKIPFNILEAAVLACLDRKGEGISTVDEIDRTSASARHRVSIGNAGPSVDIFLRELLGGFTEIYFDGPFELKLQDLWTPEMIEATSYDEAALELLLETRVKLDELLSEIEDARNYYYGKLQIHLLHCLSNEFGSLRSKTPLIKRVVKGSRTKFTLEQKHEAYMHWENMDKNISPIVIEEFLEYKFGYKENGDLIVAKSTFYGWKHQLIDKGFLPRE